MSEPAASDTAGDWPSLSVVVPVRNEARHLERAVEAILEQAYPAPFDICLAVGPSDDGTEDVAQRLATTYDAVSVVANPSGRTPAGLNAAIRATSGEIVVRVDGHSRLGPSYLTRAVESLRTSGAVNVGGIQAARGETPFERAVAHAMTSRWGTGGARFHVGGAPGPVDTVYLGVFRRGALESVGLFDERLVRNQDYELNIRLRAAGGTVWFDPGLQVEYRPRGSIVALARQYFEYGWWKAEVAHLHPGSLKPRQVAPVALTVALVASPLLGRWRWGRRLPAAYACATLMVALGSAPKLGRSALRLAVVLPTMHLSWGLGFIASSVGRRSRGTGRTEPRRSTTNE